MQYSLVSCLLVICPFKVKPSTTHHAAARTFAAPPVTSAVDAMRTRIACRQLAAAVVHIHFAPSRCNCQLQVLRPVLHLGHGHATRGRSAARSSPLLGNDALLLADPALTCRKAHGGRSESQPAGHAGKDSAAAAPPAAATSRLAEPSAAVSPAMAQQDDNSSAGSCKGSTASAPEPLFDGTPEAQGCETPSSSAQGRPSMAARGPSSDPPVPQGQQNDPGGDLEMVDLAQQVKSLLQADIPEPIRRSFNLTAAAIEDLQGKFVDYAAHAADMQAGAYQQRREQQRRDTELSDALTSDLQALQTRLEEAERRAFEWADRAMAADECVAAADTHAAVLESRLVAEEARNAERVAAADTRAAALESRLVAEEAHSADNFRTVMVYVNRLEAKVNSLLDDAAASPQQRRQLSYTPGSAYHSAQQMLSAPRAELNELNLRTFGGSAVRRDDDERSRISMHSSRSLLRPTPAIQLPPHPGSVNDPPISSATATVRDISARSPVAPFSFSLALPPAKAPAHEGDKGSLKDDARAQLDGAVARGQQLWTLTQTQARTDPTQQLAAERAEHDTKVAATEAALQCEQELLRVEREEVERSARANELLLRQTQLEALAQERELAAKRAAMHAEQRAFEHARCCPASSGRSRTTKQRPMWPALIKDEDFGSKWFSSVVRAVINCIISGGGDNYLVSSLTGEAAEWQKDREALTVSDTEQLEWFFTRIAKFLELRRPAELAADLVMWVVKPGFPLKDFVYEYSAASTAVLSADPKQDLFVLSALLEVCRQQYAIIAPSWAHIDEHPHKHTTRNLLEILRRQAERAKYQATSREDNRAVYPSDLRSYSKGVSGGGSGLPPKQQPQQQQQQKPSIAERNASSSTGPARTCFNCGSDQHVFARCTQPYNAANWQAAVEKLPWVAKFRPSGDEDFKRLCAKALER
ncbi:hypothetical protein JKP88DRAFT_245250 [Tribonema minus]|uniref:Uncharacterized protein n=1 Tax=Tribonema minus TaxID=303371 RepID=A0A835Z0H2_9STRA|nr:hypothetical protein JKP88DRAFT_245250 [Tribonema minus]